MNRILSWGIGIALATLASCSLFSTSIKTDSIKELCEAVIDRHDVYVSADELLSDVDRDLALGQSTTLGDLLQQSAVEPSTFSGALQPVADRHDVYVRGDPNLIELERRVFLRSTEELRGLNPD